jgi:hypothetical protein
MTRAPVIPIALADLEDAMADSISGSSPEQRCRGGLRFRILISVLAPFLLPACLAAEPGAADAATYHCENGNFFSAEFFGRSSRVTTLRNSYLLERRPSSIGRKYSAGNVFFIRDEDRAVLVGAADGPYRRCSEG